MVNLKFSDLSEFSISPGSVPRGPLKFSRWPFCTISCGEPESRTPWLQRKSTLGKFILYEFLVSAFGCTSESKYDCRIESYLSILSKVRFKVRFGETSGKVVHLAPISKTTVAPSAPFSGLDWILHTSTWLQTTNAG